MNRWDDLFADVEGRSAAWDLAERAAEIEDRTRSELSRIAIADRLRAAVNARLQVSCRGGLAITGQLARVHGEWLLMVHEHGRESLVATRHVQSIRGLGRYSSPSTTQSTVDLRFGLNLALRRVARERSSVRLHLVDGVIDGTIDRVGSDFCDVALHAANEPRRRGTVREVALVPIAALVAATRAA